MTPVQQTALEDMAGRPLTALEVGYAQSRNDGVLAASLSAGRTAKSDYWITDVGLVADLVSATGSTAMSDSVLTKLDAAMQTSRSAKTLIERLYNDARGLNFGDTSLLAWFGEQTPLVFTAAENAAIQALCMQPAPLPVERISAILNGDPT